MLAVWASHHEALCCDGVVGPHGFAPLMRSALGVVLSGATHRRQPWTPAVRLPHRRDRLSALLMAVLWTFHRPSMCRPGRRECTRIRLRDWTTLVPVNAYPQRHDVETYRRCRLSVEKVWPGAFLPGMLLMPGTPLWHNNGCLSWTLGREPWEAIAITNDTKAVDHACPSCPHHVRSAWEGRRTHQGHGRPLPCCAAGIRLPAVRGLSEYPAPRQARRARTLGRPSGARRARTAQRHPVAEPSASGPPH